MRKWIPGTFENLRIGKLSADIDRCVVLIVASAPSLPPGPPPGYLNSGAQLSFLNVSHLLAMKSVHKHLNTSKIQTETMIKQYSLILPPPINDVGCWIYRATNLLQNCADEKLQQIYGAMNLLTG